MVEWGEDPMPKLAWGSRSKKPKDESENAETNEEIKPPPLCEVSMADIRSRPNNELSEDVVVGIMDSISRLGMQNPISLRESQDQSIKYDVLAGHHRYEAYSRLGFLNVTARIFAGVEAELQRYSENQHRRELTLLEKYADIAGYQSAIAKSNPEDTAGGIQPNDKGVSKTARDRGVSRKVVQAAVAASKLGKQIKSAIASSRLANNASLIGRLTEIESPEDQMRELLRHKSATLKKTAPAPQIDTVTFVELLANWKKSKTSGLWLRAPTVEQRRFIKHITSDLQEDENVWE